MKMPPRALLAATLAVLIVALLASPALAGGWATAELQNTLDEPVAGEPLRIEFVLLQHGVTPTDWTTTFVTATTTGSDETVRADATFDRDLGHWVALLTLPSDGTWSWKIETNELFVETTFPALVVGGSAVLPGAGAVTTTDLTAAIDTAKAEIATTYDKQLSNLDSQVGSMQLEVDTLGKQVGDLTAERDSLQKQIAELQSAQAPAATESNESWWLASLVGAAAAIVVIALGYVVVTRRGILSHPEVAPSTAR